MSDDEKLRGRAREALRTGRLPCRAPKRIWGGPGTGARCDICGEPIGRNENELELQFAEDYGGTQTPGSGKPAGKSAEAISHLHVRCFAAWELERGAEADCRPTAG